MKKILILFLLLLTCSCHYKEVPEDEIDYSINMDKNFIINDLLEDGQNK